jgi:hypothetical protein
MLLAFPLIMLLTFLILWGIIGWWGEDIEWREEGDLWVVNGANKQDSRK